MANSMVLWSKILNPGLMKSIRPLICRYALTNRRSPYIFKDFTYLRCTKDPKGCAVKTNSRNLSDKLSKKGRGDEANYFLRLSREQFVKIKEQKIKEIIADIRALEIEVRDMDRKTSLRAEKVRQNLMVEIRELKAMLEKFKKTL